MSIDLINETDMPVPAGILEGIKSGVLTAYNDSDYIHGIILLDEGPMLVVCRPIMKNHAEGPYAGTLILGNTLMNHI